MIQKLLAGVSFAAVAVLAMLLVTVANGSAKPAEARVTGISVSHTTIGTTQYAQLNIFAEDDLFGSPTSTDNVEVTASAGDFIEFDPTLPLPNVLGCTDDLGVPCSLFVDSNGSADDGVADRECDDDLLGVGDTAVSIETVIATTGTAILGPLEVCPGFNTTELELWWQAPAGFMGTTVTFVACQDSVCRTTSINVLGSVASLNLVALRDVSTSTALCSGTPVFVIAGVEYSGPTLPPATTFDNSRAILCVDARDSNNVPIAGASVIFTVTGGGCVTPGVATTGALPLGSGLAQAVLTACTTGNSGDIATVTAQVGAATDSVQVEFGGDPASCTMVVDPDVLDIGDNAAIDVTFIDELDNKVPDGIVVNFAEVDSGDGFDNVEIVDPTDDTVKSMADASIIAAISGLTTIAASIESFGASDAVCSEAIELSGDVHVHDDVCEEDPDFILFGNKPPLAGGFGTFAFCGGSYERLLLASGCPRATSAFFYNKPSGTFAVWIPGTEVSAANAEIFTIFPPEHSSIPRGTIFTAKCR